MNVLLKLIILFGIGIQFTSALPLGDSQIMASNQFIIHGNHSNRPSLASYTKLRNKFMKTAEMRSFGSQIKLNANETIANGIIMRAKDKELVEGLLSPRLFTPSQHFFSVIDKIHRSDLFKILELMPKGGVLHSHDISMCSVDFLIQLTYKDDLWLCSDKDGEAQGFLFAKEKPQSGTNCSWEQVSKKRQEKGAEKFDEYLFGKFSFYPKERYIDNNDVWEKFNSMFQILDGLLTYAPVWGEYYYQVLKEFYADNVQYVEVRTTIPLLYDFNGTIYDHSDTVRIWQNVSNSFTANNPGFIGSKLIYAPNRHVSNATVAEYINTSIKLKKLFPDFFAGFDMCGQEVLGEPFVNFLPLLLQVPNEIDFYFHAGETNWFGTTTDENVIDAVLLGTKRVGHGFALIKHPQALDLLKKNDIAIEVSPISNQVLQLVNDLRNHPCSYYFANNYPVVISSDNRSCWQSSPLSDDFYVTFLGIASGHSDLRLLKQLAINSIKYSAMNGEEKELAFKMWQAKWDDYIAKLVVDERFV